MGLERDLLSSVPIWVRFPSLDLKLWSKSIISRIASMVGIPLYMDRATATGERISYARVFIKIRADKDLVNKVRLQVEEGEVMDIELTYERITPICKQCNTFGHVEKQCPTSAIWMPKNIVVEKNKMDESHNDDQNIGINPEAQTHSTDGGTEEEVIAKGRKEDVQVKANNQVQSSATKIFGESLVQEIDIKQSYKVPDGCSAKSP